MGKICCNWSRRLGVVTLFVACVFMCGWIRGHSVEDVYIIGNGSGHVFHEVHSHSSGIIWFRFVDNEDLDWIPGWYRDSVRDEPYDPLDHMSGFQFYPDDDPRVVEYRRQFLGFDTGKSHFRDCVAFQMSWVLIPYGFIVIPLTLVSAYLLLRKI